MRFCAAFALVVLSIAGVSRSPAAAPEERGAMAMHSLEGSVIRPDGAPGERIAANVDGWLLHAPRANPGMLGMFRMRDRLPAPRLVPWVGEFAGKYLLSCVGALRLADRPDLRESTREFVSALIASRADDGYLGPFPHDRRLLGEWDLWGHYHVMQGLLAWHDLTGDAEAMESVRMAAALICRTYLDGDRRVIDAGSDEMNMAVSHVMAGLYRRTGDPRCLALVRQIEADWEKAGDYLRTGVAGIPFYRTPRPRWESLHDLQTLVELWRITGETRYRDAFANHWRSIRDFDVRNSGAFSGGEQATGNPWAPTAIETCCTVAWMAISVDMLQLTGDPAVAEELERSTFNAAFGAQHPGGRWWTYNTPMDGERRASAHDIVFQARAGTPELNCCSVNGPRAPGMAARWAVMREAGGLVVNTHFPMTLTTPDAQVRMECESDYPVDGRIVWRIVSAQRQRVRFRIPSWADGAGGSLNGEAIGVDPGSYCTIDRRWEDGDVVAFDFPMRLRTLAGDREQAGKVSVFRGPLLLAWDQADNEADEIAIPSLSPDALAEATAVVRPRTGSAAVPPGVLVDVSTAGGTVRLREFATAGMSGTRYRSWLRIGDVGQAAIPPLATAASAAIAVTGPDDPLEVPLPAGWASGDFSVTLEANIREFPEGRIGQVFSAWCAAGDDPLRIFVSDGRLHAAIEGNGGARTEGVRISPGTWHRIAAVRDGAILTLFLDGQPVSAAVAPAAADSRSERCALGGNPLFTGAPEHLCAEFRRLAIHRRALTAQEVSGAAAPEEP